MKTFLADLYDVDPSLKSREMEIIPLIEKLLASDPATAPDPAFVQRLRMQLQDRAAELSAPAASGLQKWLFAFGGAVTAAVVIPLAFIVMQPKTLEAPADQQSRTALFSNDVRPTDAHAFGVLSGIGPELPRTGGGGAEVAPMAQKSVAYGANDVMVAPQNARMMAPNPYAMTRYEYVYPGTLKDLTAKVSVFKRDPSGKNIPVAAFASAFNLGTIDPGTFMDMKIDSISMSQNRPYGYMLNVDLRNASVTLDAQWDQWPQSKCQTEQCALAARVRIGDVPSDADLITVAQAFAKNHGIDLSHYGRPEVDRSWMRDDERAHTPEDAYVPDTMRVVFPLLIDGKSVYDQSGMKTGVSIGVYFREAQVMNVYGLMDRTYLKSDYDGVTDQKAIMDFIAKTDNWGGVMPMMEKTAPEGPANDSADQPVAISGGGTAPGMMPIRPGTGGATPDVQVSTVTLGDPTVAYVQYFRYTNNVTEELLVPSLIFPVQGVKGMDSASYQRTSVIVPLAADMLKEQNGGGGPILYNNVKPM